MSQVPSDVPQADPAKCGNPDIFAAGLFIAAGAPAIAGIAGEGLMGVGALANNAKVFGTGVTLYNAVATTGAAATQARSAQGSGAYSGVDDWENITLPKGSNVWGGEPGESNFFTSDATIMDAGNDATKIFKGLQVGLGEHPSYRAGMTLYTTIEDVQVARSIALANPQHGPGGYEQYYIPDFKEVLEPIFTFLLGNR